MTEKAKRLMEEMKERHRKQLENFDETYDKIMWEQEHFDELPPERQKEIEECRKHMDTISPERNKELDKAMERGELYFIPNNEIDEMDDDTE